MWISKKKWESLEKRIADLEGQVQGQQVKPDFLVSGPYGLSQLKQALRGSFSLQNRRQFL